MPYHATMKPILSSKERWLAALHMKPVDRLPFWPKLGGGYAKAQAPVHHATTIPEFHTWIGSDPHVGVFNCLRETRKRTSVEDLRNGDELRTLFKCPSGHLEMVQLFNESTQSWHPVKHPVETREDIKLMTEIVEDVSVEVDPETLQKAKDHAKTIGQSAITTNNIGTSALMNWVEHLAGVENAHFLLADYPDEVEALFAAKHRHLKRRTELLCENSPADVLYLTENTSTTLISPDQYRRYCAPVITEYAAIVRRSGRILILHMCGHLKALLPDLARVGARAFEAFTSPTLGDTTLLDGRTHCPDVCLIGGTNAMLWTRSAKEIIAGIEAALDPLPHHRGLVVTSAGVMPPLCAPETIREVCEWVKRYPARLG